MKVIKYNLFQSMKRDGTPNLAPVTMHYSEESLAVAKKEAYNGEYFIEDDGVEEVTTPSQLDIIEAQVTYTAMMTNTLLEAE